MYHYIIYIPSLQFMIQHLIYLNCRISVERGWPGAERVSMLSLTALGKRGRTGIWQLLNHLILSWKCDKIPCTPLSPNLTSIIKISPTFILPHTTHITNCENKHFSQVHLQTIYKSDNSRPVAHISYTARLWWSCDGAPCFVQAGYSLSIEACQLKLKVSL